MMMKGVPALMSVKHWRRPQEAFIMFRIFSSSLNVLSWLVNLVFAAVTRWKTLQLYFFTGGKWTSILRLFAL